MNDYKSRLVGIVKQYSNNGAYYFNYSDAYWDGWGTINLSRIIDNNPRTGNDIGWIKTLSQVRPLLSKLKLGKCYAFQTTGEDYPFGPIVRIIELPDERHVYKDVRVVKETYNHYTNDGTLTIYLDAPKDRAIIESIQGQLSDGMWENSPRMETYWNNFHIVNDHTLIINMLLSIGFQKVAQGCNNEEDARNAIKAWFARKAKQIVKTEEDDGHEDAKWDRHNNTVLRYFHNNITVADVYRFYDKWMGRNTSNKTYESFNRRWRGI